MNRKLLSTVMALLTLSSTVHASGAGTTGANVLNFAVGARAVGMGEAFTAMADDVSSLYWNPAGIALLNQSQASFMHNQSIEGLSFSHAATALSLENGGIGASISYLSFGDINGFDAQGNATGNVKAYSGVGTIGGGWLFDTFSLGANIKGIQGSLADVTARGFAFDLGGNFVYPQELLNGSTLRLAGTVRNLGSGMQYLQYKDDYPLEIRGGASLLQLLNKKLNVSLDYVKVRDEKGAMLAGVEYWVIPFLALRGGYSGRDTEGSGLRAGIGFKVRDIAFDYAYAGYGDLGISHRYELSMRFGEIRPRLTPEERRLLRQAKNAIREERFGEAVLLCDSLMKVLPKYRPVHYMYRVALAGHEAQERAGQGQNNYSIIGNRKAQGTLSDLDDLEQLLSSTDAQLAKSEAKAAAFMEKK
jgi:hypothetical protein